MATIFKAKSVNQTITECSTINAPMELWGQYWLEGEACCLYADTNLGKSVLAVQIADHVSRMIPNDQSVLYYDFELSGKQFEMRYTNQDTHDVHKFRNNFIRVELDSTVLSPTEMAHLEDIIIEGIEENIAQYNSKYIIIDNISWLVNMKSSAAAAGVLMQKLSLLKKKYGLSALVLAHTKKRNLKRGIDENDLGGSKKFANFFDAMFTIGRAKGENGMRYLKQVKVRSGAFKHGPDNVEVCKLGKAGANLVFTTVGEMKEEDAISYGMAKKESLTKKKMKGGKSELAESQIRRVEEWVNQNHKKRTVLDILFEKK